MSPEVENDNPVFCIAQEKTQNPDLNRKVVFCEVESKPEAVQGVPRKAVSLDLMRTIFDYGLIDERQLETASRFRQAYHLSSVAARPNADVSDRVARGWRKVSQTLRALPYRQRVVAIEIICSDHLVKGITSAEVRSTLDNLSDHGY